ncbi:MAG: DUF2934 domain-containing protein [Kiritimatiellales bacterium]
MAIEKKTTKKTVKKAVVKKAAVAKPVAVKPAAPKVAAKKAPAKAAGAKKTVVAPERFYAMVSEAAYFSAQNDGNRKGAAEYWVEAEAAVRAKFNVA